MMMQPQDRQADTNTFWQAVCDRDGNYDGVFVYAVRSTGVYCRPSCPSRRPGRGQVTFFAAPDAAEAAGFRACKRCTPRASDPQAEIVTRACRYIDEHLDSAPTLADIGTHVGMSPYHLQRVFKRVMGISPREYADHRRLQRFKDRVRAGDEIATAIYDSGYGASSRLYEKADQSLGMTPATYGKGGAGMDIFYTISDSPLGRVLIAITERGVCGISLGHDDAELEQFLLNEYPAAQIYCDSITLDEWVQAILSYLNGWQPHLDLPLDVRATAFQRRVWSYLCSIPPGETRTYREVAEAIGQPTAFRAVAQACASNPVALVVPCHRVVRSDGSLSGYRWGVERKRALLDAESETL